MTSLVKLRVFSGRPNPVFALSGPQEQELIARLERAQTLTGRRPSGVFGGLGYGGFSISRPADDPAGPLEALVHEGVIDRGLNGPNAIDNVDLEGWLANIVGPQLSERLREHVRNRLVAAPTPDNPAFALAPRSGAVCPQCNAPDAPAYNPGIWNVPAVQPYNNCYNYANNQITNTFAQPGRATGHEAQHMTCADVTAAATSDGLQAVPNFSAPLQKGGGWYVALVIWPGQDYHWYRQDNSGCWSHKSGQGPARDIDAAGNPIVDPQTCDRGPYTDFCTYMVTNYNVHIQ